MRILLILFMLCGVANAQTSTISLGKATNAAPTYPEGAMSPFSFDLSGNLRTSAGAANASVGATGAAVPASATYLGINVGGNLTGWDGVLKAGSAVIGHVITDTGSTTAVTQATAASLNATVVGTGTFGVQATLAAETTKVIGTVNQGTSPWVVSGTTAVTQGTSPWVISGNLTNISGTISLPTGAATAANQTSVIGTTFSGATPAKGVLILAYSPSFDTVGPLQTDPSGKLLVAADVSGSSVTVSSGFVAVTGGTTPSNITNSSTAGNGVNSAILGVFDDVSPTSITEDNFGSIRMSSNRNLYNTIRDAAGNERGVNVTSGNALSSDITTIGGVTTLKGNGVTGTGSQRVTIASDNTAFSVNAAATQSGTWNIGTVTTVSTVTAVTSLTNALPAGTNSIGGVTPLPTTSGGLSVYFVQPTASDNHVVIKNGAGQVYKIDVFNNSATVNYLRLYNAGTGFNGCNSATNLVGQWQIPASTTVGGISSSWDLGIAFATGISICVTSAYATTDTTNATASAMSINIGYK